MYCRSRASPTSGERHPPLCSESEFQARHHNTALTNSIRAVLKQTPIFAAAMSSFGAVSQNTGESLVENHGNRVAWGFDQGAGAFKVRLV
jgi:hypothetical protein